jgi:hypothetical protein
MKISRYDDLVGGSGHFQEVPYTRDNIDFLVLSLSARTRLPNGKWLYVGYHLNHGTSWRLVGNFDRKAELSVSMSIRATDENNVGMVELLPPGKITDTRQLVGTDLEKLIPIIDAAIGVILFDVQTSKTKKIQQKIEERKIEAARSAEDLEKLKRRAL